jgi:DedD protein
MKQRLVGTLVLGSLALILIPLLLDGEGVERPPLSANIPPAPAFDTTPLPEPERPTILADTLTPEPAGEALDTTIDSTTAAATETVTATPDEAPAETVATEAPPPVEPAAEEVATTVVPPEPEPAAQSTSEPALDAAGLPEAWAIRLGSFGNRANADSLVTRLVAAGHKAYIRPVQTGQGTLSGVYVGPLPTRAEAVALQAELKSRFQISDAIVQRFDVGQ